MNLYAYVGNDPLNATDPTGEEEISFIFVADPGSHGLKWDHAAIFVAADGENPSVLYDPSGSFRASDGYGGTYRNRDDFYGSDQSLLREFINYETRDNRSVSVITIFADDETSAKVRDNIENREFEAGFAECANMCSRVSKGTLKNSGKHTNFPGTLRKRSIKDAKKTGGLERVYSGRTDQEGRPLTENSRIFEPGDRDRFAGDPN